MSNSLVLDLQQEVLKSDCDIVTALRKAHLIATKLQFTEFDEWILNELNGYKKEGDNFPDYRQMQGELKAKNPYRGWIPVVISGLKSERFTTIPVFESLSALIDIESKAANGHFMFTYPPELSAKICKESSAPIYMEIALFISTYRITDVVEKVKTCLLEWTLELERKGILGENMTFNENETEVAKEVPQQTNYYYGPVINGNVSSSQIVSGDNNVVTYDSSSASNAIQEIRDSFEKESISIEDKESAIELLEEISEKIQQNKKPSIIKSALVGLKDFAIAVGANATASLIAMKIQGVF